MFQITKRWLPGDSPGAIRAELEEATRAVATEARVSLVREPDMERVAHINSEHISIAQLVAAAQVCTAFAVLAANSL